MTYKKKICLEKSMITSTSNQQMKNLMLLMKKAKARNEQELFVVEGRKMFQEVPEEWLKQVYVSESFFAENDKMLAGYTYEIEGNIVTVVYQQPKEKTRTATGVVVDEDGLPLPGAYIKLAKTDHSTIAATLDLQHQNIYL